MPLHGRCKITKLTKQVPNINCKLQPNVESKRTGAYIKCVKSDRAQFGRDFVILIYLEGSFSQRQHFLKETNLKNATEKTCFFYKATFKNVPVNVETQETSESDLVPMPALVR